MSKTFIATKGYTISYLIDNVSSLNTKDLTGYMGLGYSLSPRKGVDSVRFAALLNWLGLSFVQFNNLISSKNLKGVILKKLIIKNLKARKVQGKTYKFVA